jgi:hypothetical protein
MKEAVGGYLFFDAADLDAAIEFGHADPGGAQPARLPRRGRRLALVHDDAERRLLQRRLAELGLSTDEPTGQNGESDGGL